MFLNSCTTNPVPEEEFEGPAGNFPRIVDVPDRPKVKAINVEELKNILADENKKANEIRELDLNSSKK